MAAFFASEFWTGTLWPLIIVIAQSLLMLWAAKDWWQMAVTLVKFAVLAKSQGHPLQSALLRGSGPHWRCGRGRWLCRQGTARRSPSNADPQC